MVPGTTYHDVVEALQEERLLVPFIAAAQALEQEGVCAITTSCGFLALFQRQLSAAVRVPVLYLGAAAAAHNRCRPAARQAVGIRRIAPT